MILNFHFFSTYVSEKKIVVFTRMILRLKKSVLIPWNEIDYSSKKRLDVSFKHTLDLIRVKINLMCYLFLLRCKIRLNIVLPMTMFHGFLNNSMELEISKSYEISVFRWLFEIARYDHFYLEYGIVDCQ